MKAGGSRGRIAASALGIVLVLGAVIVPLAAVAQVPGGVADFGGVSTGSVIHVDALQAQATRLADVEVASSGASMQSRSKLGQQITNEMQRVVQPALPNKVAFGRGTGLEVGLAVQPSGVNQVILSADVQASALPSTELLTKDIPVSLAPLAYVGLARGQGQARWDASGDPCGTLGSDLSYGLGYVSDVQLLDMGSGAAAGQLAKPVLATDHQDPARTVSQSMSHTLLVPQINRDGSRMGSNFGILSETRQTIAPITLFKGTAMQMTIELAGEWVLQALSTGLPNGAFVHFGPAATSPETPVVRIIDALGKVTQMLTSQQVLGQQGLTLTVPGVVDIAIGEDPRAIGGDANSQPTQSPDGTRAAAAVDVVRLKLLEQTSLLGLGGTARVADLRVGHMEVQSNAPAGGISCTLPVAKSGASSVGVGGTFPTKITVSNPFECAVENVSLTDTIGTEQGARFKVASTTPAANQTPAGDALASGKVVWSNIGSIGPNSGRDVSMSSVAGPATGIITDSAVASGTLACSPDSALGRTKIFGLSVANTSVAGPSAPMRVGVGQVLAARASSFQVLPRSGRNELQMACAGLMMIALGAAAMWTSKMWTLKRITH